MVIREVKYEPLGKKHNWTERQSGFIFDLVIKDENGGKIDRFIWNTNKKYREILELLRLKYGLEYHNPPI